MRKLLIVLTLALLAYGFFVLDLSDSLTLDGLKAHLGKFEARRAASPVGAGLAFFALYVGVASLSLPLATLLALAAGALFGLLAGTLIASFASSIGATLAFLTSRYLLHDAVQHRFAGRLAAVNHGMARDGALYLFTLRLVPLFPFFLINLLMGLTPIPTRTFYWVSQLGMLAGTLIYVNAGTQLAQLSNLSDIASPGLLISLALLGLFPWLATRLVKFLRARRR